MSSITGTLQQFAIPALVGAICCTLAKGYNLGIKLAGSIAITLITHVFCQTLQSTRQLSNTPQKKIQNAETAVSPLTQGIEILESVGLSTDTNRNALNQQALWIKIVVEGLEILRRIGLLEGDQAQANFDLFMQRAVEHTCGLRILTKDGLSNEANERENCYRLIQNTQYAQPLSQGLIILNKDHLLKGYQRQAIFNALIQNTQYAWGLAKGLVALHKANLFSGFQGQVNFTRFVQNAQFAWNLARVFEALQEEGLLEGAQGQENFDEFILNASRAEEFDLEGAPLTQEMIGRFFMPKFPRVNFF